MIVYLLLDESCHQVVRMGEAICTCAETVSLMPFKETLCEPKWKKCKHPFNTAERDGREQWLLLKQWHSVLASLKGRTVLLMFLWLIIILHQYNTTVLQNLLTQKVDLQCTGYYICIHNNRVCITVCIDMKTYSSLSAVLNGWSL